ncbi:MAG: SAM-dependent DNA methyltransferase [Verrucomicrobiaceae bacterium]|nr:MAG: SAM-dependent DNA methyltransferase [Verrucomicrobiaceae bacterium]
MADKLRSNMDAADYKHVVLGLIFLKFISDRFEQQRAKVQATPHADPEDRDEYLAQGVFWVPKEARWASIQATAPQSTIGQTVDDAMYAIERENPSLKDVLPKNYARADLDKSILAGVINLVADIDLAPVDGAYAGQDVLGRVYEYFLGQFAAAEGKKGGQFYTPACIVQLLVEMLQPFKGRVYDPCCGSGGMFVQSERFVEAHGGRLDDLSVYGQESNPQTWRLAQMNLAIRGISANLGQRAADSFHDDLHPDLKADFILANPPFNVSDWGVERRRNDLRWRFAPPPNSNANFAWVQHFIHHLAPHGLAGFVLANGSMSSNQSGEGDIRQAIVGAELVDCVVSLPGQLFYTTQIPVCLWFLARDKSNGVLKDVKLRDRRGETLFIDARGLGSMQGRTLRVLTPEDISKIADTYHAWREGRPEYADIAGFCRTVKTVEIGNQGFILTPGRYVGAAETADEGEPFELAFPRLKAELEAQSAEARRLDEEIAKQLARLG